MFRRLSFMFTLSLLLAGCQLWSIQSSHSIPTREISRIATGSYDGIAWLNQNTILVTIDKGTGIGNDGLFHTKLDISALDLTSGDLRPTPFKTTCQIFGIKSFQVLPNNHVGYIFSCTDVIRTTKVIQELNLDTMSSSDLYDVPSTRSIHQFVYSPNMNDLIIVGGGKYFDSNLYYLDANGDFTNITPELLRADFPTWSTTTDLIAYLGTKPYPGSDDKIDHFSQTEARLDYPWQLFLYNPRSLTTEEFALDLFHPSSLRWSPNGNMLGFAGEYRGIPGVWIIDNLDDPENLNIIRVVNGLAAFDFSPDGKSIAFAYIGLQNKEKQNILYIVDLPDKNIETK
ncbi:MAG TPA: hypothetical protein DCX53_04690 [Anaerolineae bacterium]|nr:hypothetical protein [Anaerolineae bacterium]